MEEHRQTIPSQYKSRTLSEVSRNVGEASVHEEEVHRLMKKKIWLLRAYLGQRHLRE